MIPKQLKDIAETDLLALIGNKMAEGRTIEYKRALPGGSDGDKKEFLADVSSFANTSGGDLVFGMDENAGLPTAIVGLGAVDPDAETRRLDSILASGLSPRIRYGLRSISTSFGSVFVIRTDRSWNGPHRVVFGGHDKFYGRNSAGKYPLDVNELRAAFNLSSTATERIRAFRADRLIALSNNQTPVPFVDTPKIVIHFLPIESFVGRQQYDLRPLYDQAHRWAPMGTTSFDRRLNLDGMLIYGVHDPCFSYTQIYRTGIIEAVQGNLLARPWEGTVLIPSQAYEEKIMVCLTQCFLLLEEVGCGAPVVVGLSLLKTKGLRMGVDRFNFDNGHPIAEENIILPETVVDDLATPPAEVLRPMFDMVWNACGHRQSLNFDADGKWLHKR